MTKDVNSICHADEGLKNKVVTPFEQLNNPSVTLFLMFLNGFGLGQSTLERSVELELV